MRASWFRIILAGPRPRPYVGTAYREVGMIPRRRSFRDPFGSLIELELGPFPEKVTDILSPSTGLRAVHGAEAPPDDEQRACRASGLSIEIAGLPSEPSFHPVGHHGKESLGFGRVVS